MSYRLAIFDFDGTLADSFPFFLSVFNQIADRHGFKRIDVARADSLRHHSAREMMRLVGMPAWKLPAASRSFIGLMRENAESIHLFEGIGAALRALVADGVRLAIVSFNSEHNVRRILGPELAALPGVYECGMSMFGKAGHIRAALRHAGVPAAHTIYIGDQDTDAAAARRAGVAFGAVGWGYAPLDALRRCSPDIEFTSVSELVKLGKK